MKQEDIALLRKYLRGKTTPSEDRYIRGLLQKNEDDENVRQILQEEWKQTSSDNQFDIDISREWREWKRNTIFHSNQTKDPVEVKVSRMRRLPSFTLIAASITAILIATVVLSLVLHNADLLTAEDNKVMFTVKKTDRGEKLNISLPDGSFIKLNSSTKLKIPSDYNTNDERVVYLEGEAFFEVTKFEGKPFKVVAGEVTTHVLGTAFNVNTFSEKHDVSVAVVRGKVEVANHNSSIILMPDEMTTVGPETEKPTKSTFDTEFIMGWRDNILVFNEVSLEKILEKLRQWYGVEFEITGKPSQGGKYSGRFENKSLPLVLEGLGFSSAFEYKIIDKTVYLNFK